MQTTVIKKKIFETEGSRTPKKIIENIVSKKITIAIDGYSSTGKSTLAKQLAKELGLNQDYPTIELNKQDETKEELTEEKIKETKDEFMLKSFEKLEKLYITEQSKNTLKKIIEYMRK